MKSVDEQMAILSRGVDQITPEDEFKKKLAKSAETGTPLRVKYGIDPTGIDVHLGHTVPLRKLRQFQELGHRAVLILGNYTALVGDPSGRDAAREKKLSPEEVTENAKDYLAQISKIIDIDKTEVHSNGDWFAEFTFLDVLRLTGQITVQRMLERDDFTKRREAGTPIWLHECLYPLMQGRDSVEVRADVELGGTEQLFTLLLARSLQEDAGQPAQAAVTLPILVGLDGTRRMGKSLGNYVGVGEPAQEQFNKIMSIPDEVLGDWFKLLTDRDLDEARALITKNPFEAKKALGTDVVAFYYGVDAGRAARAEWEKVFSKGEDPTDIPEAKVAAGQLADGAIDIVSLLVLTGLTKSKGDARRTIGQNGVSVGPDRDAKVTDPAAKITIGDGVIVRVGSKRIVRAVVG